MSKAESSLVRVAFLTHRGGDHVAIAVRDVDPGPASVLFLDSDKEASIDVLEPIPLGHKVALVDLGADHPVVEYDVQVAITRNEIARGQLVHIHNIRSARWQNSLG